MNKPIYGLMAEFENTDDLLDAALPDDWRQQEAWPTPDWPDEVTHG